MAHVDLDWHGDEAIVRTDAAIARGVRRGLDDISGVSQDRVPVLTTELKKSQGTDHDGNRGSIFYTDNKAAVAHENPRKFRYRNGKREKFLESALNDGRDDFQRAVAEEVRRAL